MNVNVPQTMRTHQLEAGQLCYHLDSGEALCMAAIAENAEDVDDIKLIGPIKWESNPSSVGVPIYEENFRSTAVLLKEFTAHADLSNPTQYAAGAVCADGQSLFLPLTNGRGMRAGFLDLATGIVRSSVSPTVGFSRWFIAESGDKEQVLWQSWEATGDEGQERRR